MTTRTFEIGGERTVRRLGFGAMRLPTEGADRARGLAVARQAVRLGIDLIDTAHLYGWGANETLLAEALHPYPRELLIATKVGIAPPGPGHGILPDGRPAFLRAQVDEGLRRLRLERIELLQLHEVDPRVPLADQVGTLAEARAQGKIAHIGLSEVTVEQLAEARAITGIATVQNRYSVLDRGYEDVVDTCEAAGIGFLPWRPVHPATTDAGEVAAVAAELGATAAQVALAWLLHRSPVMLPIPGTGSLAHLEENAGADELALTPEQFARLDRLARP
ncbi:aldo/keto reductase [Streptomyces sedi]|uniref:Aldo/keto reductase n=1 Tax=Streptomyces sedi TaxID=555059 RepID=A0A5C4VA23_9ACTN|nr:aldo/keto reductase [Streptomyces sedi]TNM32346.1 aldo/keto reductase [Streptomyces sedi]